MSDTTQTSQELNGFAVMGAELWRRTQRPVLQFVYWTFFLLSVVGLGGLGLWLELIRPSSESSSGVFTALVTFFPALIGSCCLQMAFESTSRRLLAFSLFCASASLVTTLVLFFISPPTPLTWCLAVLACLVALWIWWIANADNRALYDDPPVDAAIGGDPNAALEGRTDTFIT